MKGRVVSLSFHETPTSKAAAMKTAAQVAGEAAGSSGESKEAELY